MMNLLDYRTRIRKILLDESGEIATSRWDKDDLNRFVNEALLEVSRSARRRKTASLSYPAGTGSQPLPSDILRLDGTPQWLSTGGTGRTSLALAMTNYPDSDEAGMPLEYWLLEDAMLVRPVPDAGGTATLVYFRRYPALALDTDTPEPQDVDGILINYSVWQALEFDGNAGADRWKALFIQQIAAWSREAAGLYRPRPAQVQIVR